MKNTIHHFLVTLLAVFATSKNASAGVHTWSGAAGTSWSTAGNWSSGGAPTAGEANVQLIFPVLSSNKIMVDDIPGLVVDLITVKDGSYVFKGGNSAKLTLSGAGASSIVITAGSGYEIHSTLPLVLNGICEIRHTEGVARFGSSISGSGGFEIHGFTTFEGPGANVYTGTTSVMSGSLILAKSTAGLANFAGALVIHQGNVTSKTSHGIPDNIPITVTDGSLNIYSSAETIGALILSNADLKFDPTNYVVTLGAAVTVTSNSSITGNFSLGSPARSFDIANGATLKVDGRMSDHTSGAGGLVKMGAGLLDLRGASIFTGAVNITAGGVLANNSAAFGTAAGGVTVSSVAALHLSSSGGDLAIGNETLNLSGKLACETNATWSGPIILTGYASEIEGSDISTGPRVFTHTGVISGTGQLKKTGSGRLTLAGSAANTYSGGTILAQGQVYLAKSSGNAIPGDLNIPGAVVSLNNSEQIANSSNVILGGTIDFGARTETIGSLSGMNGYLKFALGTLITGGNNTNTTFEGTLSGYGNTCLIKNGTGDFTLKNFSGIYNPNSLDGDLSINAGTLTVNGVQLGDVTVNTGALLRGNGTVGNVVLNGGKVNLSTLTIASLSSINNTSQIIGDIQGENQFGHLKATGTVNISGTSFSGMLGYNPYAGASFMLIDNDGTDAIIGNFSGFPEGASVFINWRTFIISYHGGDGNDVVLTLVGGGLQSPVITYSNFDTSPGPGMHLHIEVHSQPNVLHQLEYSDDLKIWQPYQGKTATSDSKGDLLFDFKDFPASKRFFRVKVS